MVERIAVFFSVVLMVPQTWSPLEALQPAPLRVDTDIAQFRYGQQENYVEIYYAFDVSHLTYTPHEEGLKGGLLLHGSLATADHGKVILNQAWRIPHEVADPPAGGLKPGSSVVGVIGLAVPEGAYRLTLESFDINDTSRKHVDHHDLPLRAFRGKEISVSDVELCSSIEKATDDTPPMFYKNTLNVVPNPGRVYSERLPSLNYYVEAYNFQVAPETSQFHTVVRVYDSRGNEVVSQKRTRPRVHESSVEVGSIDISSLFPGSYLFEFSLVDSATDSRVTSKKEFYIYDPRVSEMATGYEVADEGDLDREFEMAKYVAAVPEIALYESLTSLQSKRRFLSQFWKRRDSVPGTVENEYRQEYLKRVEYANSRFRTANKEGWQTDRGRVYIVYGPADEYERHDSGPVTKPYEIWYYNELQGGVHFVFADLFGFRDHILLHSTHRNELRDDTWQLQIREN